MKMRLKALFTKPITLKKGAAVLLLAVLLVALGYGGYMAYIMFVNPIAAFSTPAAGVDSPADPDPDPIEVNISAAVPEEAGEGQIPEEMPEITPDPEAKLLSQADMEFLKNRVNILLVGVDEDNDRDETWNRKDYRSDALMLLTIDLESKTADLVSIPRDTYAEQYKMKGRWKINACMAHGGGLNGDGFLYARETVSMLFGGIPIPYHIGVQMDGLKKVVDIIGGVDYDVDLDMRMNGRELHKGQQRLTGQQVLDYCRIRKGIGTDINRADRQQRILFAIFDQFKREGKLTQIPDLFVTMQEYLYTNLNVEQIAALAVFAVQLDQETGLHRHTLAGEYMTGVYNFSFYALNQQKKCDMVKQVFGVTIKPDKLYDAAFIKKDWARIQAESTIQQAQAAVDSAPAWAQTEEVSAGISMLTRALDDFDAQSADELDAATAALAQAVESLNNALLAAAGQLPPYEFPQEPFQEQLQEQPEEQPFE